jgi:hypothetical protein
MVSPIRKRGASPVDQIDPGEIQGETVSGVSLPHPNINIKESIENAVKEISENINITVSVNKKDQVCIPWRSI